MTSKQMIEWANADYKMLKDKGKEGEEVLHYHGFLDGCGRGFTEGRDYAIGKVISVLRETGYFENEEGFSEEVMIDQFIQTINN